MQRVSLLFLLIHVPAVVLGNFLGTVPVYIGDDARLPSGANPAWHLSIIEWSIYTNTTWIATYRTGTLKVERVYLYLGRLSLDIPTGDLVIRNVVPSDTLNYTVALWDDANNYEANKVYLDVRKRLQTPIIKKVSVSLVDGICVAVFKCSSLDSGVKFSWSVNTTVGVSSSLGLFDVSFLLLRLVSGASRPMEVTCTVRAKTENASIAAVAQCGPPSSRCTWQERLLMIFIGGLLVGVVAAALIYFLRVRSPRCMTIPDRYLWTTADDVHEGGRRPNKPTNHKHSALPPVCEDDPTTPPKPRYPY